MPKKKSWPKVKYNDKGPKVPPGTFQKLGFGWELDYYDFLHRYNGGRPTPNCFEVKLYGEELAVAKVNFFLGIYEDIGHERDLRSFVYRHWNDLPRGALPIASIDIPADDWDLCALITFQWSGRMNKVYLLANPHDFGPSDPHDLAELHLVANSLPTFLKSLKPYEHFYFRTWFELPVAEVELNAVAEHLAGARDGDWRFAPSAMSEDGVTTAFHSAPNFQLWLGKPDVRFDGAKAPKNASKDSCLLAVDANRRDLPNALKHLKGLLKALKLDRKLRKIGETTETRNSRLYAS